MAEDKDWRLTDLPQFGPNAFSMGLRATDGTYDCQLWASYGDSVTIEVVVQFDVTGSEGQTCSDATEVIETFVQ